MNKSTTYQFGDFDDQSPEAIPLRRLRPARRDSDAHLDGSACPPPQVQITIYLLRRDAFIPGQDQPRDCRRHIHIYDLNHVRRLSATTAESAGTHPITPETELAITGPDK